MQRPTTHTAKPLPLAERKALVASVAKNATGKAKAGMPLIDFREPTAKERAFAKTLVPKASKALARRKAA